MIFFHHANFQGINYNLVSSPKFSSDQHYKNSFMTHQRQRINKNTSLHNSQQESVAKQNDSDPIDDNNKISFHI